MKEVAIQTVLTLVLGVIFGTIFVATTYGMKTYAEYKRETENPSGGYFE